MNHKILAADSAVLLYKSYEIRQRVFVNEQGVPEAIVHEDAERSAHYFVAIDEEGNALGTARWRKTAQGVKLERFAVLPAHRNKGLGADLLRSILVDIKSKFGSGVLVYLNAQLEAITLYTDQGFLPVGQTFIEADITHQRMSQTT
jgi:predicted GNAT family N-acyltransferase|tara:strand:+ start:74 stop:511 length:438 start_codon:yes stop_codon:yes gene_type:complete